MTHESIRIGIDLGGTKTEAIALGSGGEVLGSRCVETPAHDYDEILRAIVVLVHEFELELQRRATVGVGTPGAVSPRTGLIKGSNTIVLNDRPLARDLARALGREVRLENDANCFALSEAADGAGVGARVVFGVILGTGVGGGGVIDGELVSGRNRIAGEWGHNPLPWMHGDEFPGLPCYCGHDGCVETFLSGAGLSRDYLARCGENLTAKAISERAEEGEVHAIETLGAYQDRLARALAGVVNMLDPDVIVLGGGLSNIARLYEGLEQRVEKYAFTDALDTKILQNAHGDSGGVRGAAWLWGKQGGPG
jgi:fructokinase